MEMNRKAQAPTALKRKPSRKNLLHLLGPGLITGASDNDPSGIATYSQAGAQFGFGMLWTMVFVYPFMAGIQDIATATLVRTQLV